MALYEAISHLPDYGGYFGYRVYKEYVEWVDIDEWSGGSPARHWTHQEFYIEFRDKKDSLMEQGVIKFQIENILVLPEEGK